MVVSNINNTIKKLSQLFTFKNTCSVHKPYKSTRGINPRHKHKPHKSKQGINSVSPPPPPHKKKFLFLFMGRGCTAVKLGMTYSNFICFVFIEKSYCFYINKGLFHIIYNKKKDIIIMKKNNFFLKERILFFYHTLYI